MRSIDRRIRRLENHFDPPENEAAWRLVTTLIERRQRRAEASGAPFETRGSAAVSILTIGLEPLPKCFARRASGGG
jgi:hypothetical protein